MSHPGLALFGAISLGLIGAGLWLRMEGAGPDAPPAAALPPPAETRAAEAGTDADSAAPEDESTGPVAAETAPETAPETGEAPAAQVVEPDPAPVVPPPADPGIGERLPAPDPAPPEATPPVSTPPEPASEPVPAAEKPALDPQAEAAPSADPAAEFAPATYAGPPAWRTLSDTGVPAEAIEEARAAADGAMDAPSWFGAVALSPGGQADSGARFFVQGYASLAEAEAGALRLCARFRENCLLVAHLVPSDFDGARDGTLSAHQGQVLSIARGDWHRGAMAFAWSPDGGAGYSVGPSDPALAARLALDRCEADRRRLERDRTDPALACRIGP